MKDVDLDRDRPWESEHACEYIGTCRCMWCAQCGEKVSGYYGHFTSHWERVDGKLHKTSEPHMCCPGNCELESPDYKPIEVSIAEAEIEYAEEIESG